MLTLIIAALVIFGVFLAQRRKRGMYEMYAGFAQDWDAYRRQLVGQRDRLWSMHIPDEDVAMRAQADSIVKRYDEDIRRVTGYIERYVSVVPPRLRKKLKCPNI